MMLSLLQLSIVLSVLWPSEAECGGLGAVCKPRGDLCVSGECRTKNGCTDRTCQGNSFLSSFDKNEFFDKCACIKQEFLGGDKAQIVFFTCIIGVLMCVGIAYRWFDKFMLSAPVLLAAFYSIPVFAMTLRDDNPSDFGTQGAGGFVLVILAMGTVIGPLVYCMQDTLEDTEFGQDASCMQLAAFMIYVFCAMAGFYAFTFGVVCFCAGFALLFCLMSIMIRRGWGGSHWEMPEFYAEERSAIRNIISLLIAIPMRFVNFALQVALMSYVFGDLWPLFGEIWHAKALIKEHLKLIFGSVIKQLPGVGQFLEVCAIVGAYLNDISEHFTTFMLNFSSTWTTNMVPAYTSVAVFEMFVILAAFVIVLSDVMLIVSPRKGAGFVGRLLGDTVSRALLYLLQVLASASHALVLALIWVRPIIRPELTERQEFFNTITGKIGYPLIGFYLVLTLLIAFGVLVALWSGDSPGGLQNGAVWLMRKNGVEIPEVEANASVPCAFLLAFLGIWPQGVMEAFEVFQRSRNYRLEVDDVLLATVNALSYPLYVVPFGTILAKLGEYLNQNPIYVAGRGFSVSSLLLTMTYVAEYVLVLWTARETMHSVEAGGPDEAEIQAAAAEGGHSVVTVLLCLLAITVLRLPLMMIRDCGDYMREGDEDRFRSVMIDSEDDADLEEEWQEEEDE